MKSTFLSAVVLTSIALLPAVVAPGQTASAGSVAPPPTLLPAASSEYSVVERGPHHRVWAKVTWETNASGRVIARTNAYTELASGMHHRDPNTGQWLESQEVIESYPGSAIARRGQHQVIFANDLATAGAIDMQTPDGKRLTSHVLGLSYFDASTGTNVLIAEVTNCVGKILPPNQVIYENAFDTLKASVRYTYTRGGFEQDIILLEALTGPEAYGLNPATTRLVVMTEFVNPPQPALQQSLATDAAGTPLEDDALDFGAMQVGTGRGFLLGQSATGAGLTVFKQWANIEGRQFLIEQVRAPDLFKAINSLPAKQGASLNSNRRAIRFTASTRELPSLKPGKADTKAMELTASRQPQKGYVLDYFFTVISTNNFTFQNDTTYFVSGPVSITWGTFEGGAVIKFTNRVNATISFAVVSCLTGPYRMAILTSKDDDSVGASISGSTGSPTNWNGAWYISSGQSDLNYLRFSFANTGAHITGGMTGQWGGPGPTIWHCQFIKCSAALEVETGGFFQGPRFSIYNTLFAGCRVCISTSNGGTPNCYNVTADGGLYFDTDTSDTITFENSIVTGCSLLGHVSAGWTIISSNAAGFYQPVGAGGYYLADGSTNRNAGTTNIPLRLLADLRQKTTYPPIVLTNNITAETTPRIRNVAGRP